MNTAVIRAWWVALPVLALSGLPTRTFAACKIGRLAELPVTMTGLRPLVSAKINGSAPGPSTAEAWPRCEKD